MAGYNKHIKRYLLVVHACLIIQFNEPIRMQEICEMIFERTGIHVMPKRLGQYLKPIVKEGRIFRTKGRDGTYYSTEYDWQ